MSNGETRGKTAAFISALLTRANRIEALLETRPLSQQSPIKSENIYGAQNEISVRLNIPGSVFGGHLLP